jgi:hypothetical protein
MDPTLENVLAARQAADKNEDKCTEIALCVAEMRDQRDYYKNEMRVSKEMSAAEAERKFIIYNQLFSEAQTKWSEALNSQVELWQKYCDLLEEYEKKNTERPDKKPSVVR